MQLPNLNASGKPDLKLLPAAPATPEATSTPEAEANAPPAIVTLPLPGVSEQFRSPHSQTASETAIAKIPAVSKAVAGIVPPSVRTAVAQVDEKTIGRALFRFLPSRGQFIVIFGVLLLAAAFLTHNRVARPGTHLASPPRTNGDTSTTAGFARQMPGQPVPIRNAATPSQTATSATTPGSLPLPEPIAPSLAAPGPMLPNPATNPAADGSGPNLPLTSPGNPSYEAKRPSEMTAPKGRLSEATPLPDARDTVPYMSPTAPSLAAGQPPQAAPSEAVGIVPRVAARELGNRTPAPTGSTLQPPVRLEGNISYPPLRETHERTGSSLY